VLISRPHESRFKLLFSGKEIVVLVGIRNHPGRVLKVKGFTCKLLKEEGSIKNKNI
jgi:hypothetical protein